MISVYNIKPKFQAKLKPIMEALHRGGFKPNHITILALMSSMGVGVYTYYNNGWIPLLVLPVFLFIRMALNAIDGMMARAYEQQSPLGEMLNEVGDVVADVSLFYPLLWRFGMDKHSHILMLFIVLMVLNEFVGVLAKAMGGARRYDGPMGKSDRALCIGLLSLAALIFPSVVQWVYTITWMMCIAMLVSCYFRIKNSLTV